MIYQKTCRPIEKAYISPPQFTYYVEFQDGVKVSKKDDVGLRMFFASIQDIEYEPTEANPDNLIESPLGYWALMGFRSGDAVNFRDTKGRVLSILFS